MVSSDSESEDDPDTLNKDASLEIASQSYRSAQSSTANVFSQLPLTGSSSGSSPASVVPRSSTPLRSGASARSSTANVFSQSPSTGSFSQSSTTGVVPRSSPTPLRSAAEVSHSV